MTIYGTQALSPFTDEAWGLGSIFIIDPAYMIPLYGGLFSTFFFSNKQAYRGMRLNHLGLLISTSYLAWSVLAQIWVMQHAKTNLRSQGLPINSVIATPTPLNTVLWRVVALNGDYFYEGFYSFFDGKRQIRFTKYNRGGNLISTNANNPQVKRMIRFTDGFIKINKKDRNLWLTDLRMGQEPFFVFIFDIGPALNSGQKPQPAKQINYRMDFGPLLRWLGRRILGEDLDLPTQ